MSLIIQKGLRVQPLLLHIERSQLRWLGVIRMPPNCGVHYVLPGESPGADTGHAGGMFLGLLGNTLVFPQMSWRRWLGILLLLPPTELE